MEVNIKDEKDEIVLKEKKDEKFKKNIKESSRFSVYRHEEENKGYVDVVMEEVADPKGLKSNL